MAIIKGEERRSREARAGARQHQRRQFECAVPCTTVPDTYTQTVKAVTARTRSTVLNARLGGIGVRARFINDACAREREEER
eukprot:3770692-Pleurochrysis_carterae.AAC.1